MLLLLLLHGESLAAGAEPRAAGPGMQDVLVLTCGAGCAHDLVMWLHLPHPAGSCVLTQTCSGIV